MAKAPNNPDPKSETPAPSPTPAPAPASPWAKAGDSAEIPQPVTTATTPAPAPAVDEESTSILDDAEQAELDAAVALFRINTEATMIRGKLARNIAANIIDGTTHYGTRVTRRAIDTEE